MYLVLSESYLEEMLGTPHTLSAPTTEINPEEI